MEFKKLLKELQILNLPANEFAVTSSGCLAVRGIREARDLDLIVTKSLWDKLVESHEVIYGGFKPKIHLSENIDASGFVNNNEVEVGVDIKNAEMIDGIRYVKLENVIKFKKMFGREKDLKDIELIEEYLKNNLPQI